MLKRPHYIALGLVALLTLVVLSLPHHTAAQLKLAIGSVFLPLFGLSKSSQQLADKAGDELVPRSKLLKEIEDLRRTNQVLQLRGMQAEALLRENGELRQLLAFQKRNLWNLKPANVILRDPANWWDTVQIDKGSLDGMRVDMPVITAQGLVGRISSVSLANSKVALVGDAGCRVSAVIEKTRESGVIVGGAGPLDKTLVTMSYMTGSSAKPGELVYTSGMGGVFPAGILIGQIAEEPRIVELGYPEARVKLSVNLGTLEDVFVIVK